MTEKPTSPLRLKRAHLLAGFLALGLMALAAGVFIPRTARANDPARKAAEPAPFTGVWTGAYQYPEGSGQRPVSFTVWVVQRGEKLTGEIQEANSFGEQADPWLHATLEGRLD